MRRTRVRRSDGRGVERRDAEFINSLLVLAPTGSRRRGGAAVLTEEERAGAYLRQAQTFESSFLENLGEGRFARRALPALAQVAPAEALLVRDYDGDGHLDVLLAGNFYATEVILGRYDASVGLFLQGDGRGGFTPVLGTTSGFLVEGEARAMALLQTVRGPRVVVAQNDDSLRVFAFPASDGGSLWNAVGRG